MSDKYKKLGKNSLLVFIGSIGSKLIAFLMLPLYTKWLSVSEYGVTDIINVYVTFLLSLITCCIAESVFVFPVNKSNEEQKSYFTSGFLFAMAGLMLSGILFYLALSLLNYINVTNSFTTYGWYIYFVVTVSFLQKYLQQFARSINKIKLYAIEGIISAVGIATFSFFLIPEYGVLGYVWSMVIAYSISAVFVFVAARIHRFLVITSFSVERCKEMLRYSIPLIPNATMWWIIGSLNRPIMEQYLGLDSVGLYAVANKFPSLVSILFSVFLVSWQISVIEEYPKKGYSVFYNKVARIVFFILTLTSLLLTIFSKLIIEITVDDKFSEAWKFMPIMGIAALFASFGGFVGQNFSAVKMSKYFFYSSIWGAIASVCFNILLIPIWGIYGAVVAFLLAYIILAVSRYLYSVKYVQIDKIQEYLLFIVINLLVYFASLFVADVFLRLLIYGLLLGLFIWLNRTLLSQLKGMMEALLTRIR